VFYSLLLALSELMPFDIAYVVAAACVVGLIGGYIRSMLRSGRLAVAAAGGLAALYLAMLVMLQLEQLALLVGSLLLLILAVALRVLTRHTHHPAAGPPPVPAA
jgi:inner membrane protein